MAKLYKLNGSGLINPTTATDNFFRALYGGMEYDRMSEFNKLQALKNAGDYYNFPNTYNSGLLQQQNQDLGNIGQIQDKSYNNDIANRTYTKLGPEARDEISGTNANNILIDTSNNYLSNAIKNKNLNTDNINSQNKLTNTQTYTKGIINPLNEENQKILRAVEVAESRGDFKSANEYRKLLLDNLTNSRTLPEVTNRIDTIYDTNKKNEQELIKEKLKREQNFEDTIAKIQFQHDLDNNNNDIMGKTRNSLQKASVIKINDMGDYDSADQQLNNAGYGTIPQYGLKYKKIGNNAISVVEVLPDNKSFKEIILSEHEFLELVNKNNNTNNASSNTNNTSNTRSVGSISHVIRGFNNNIKEHKIEKGEIK